MPLARPNTQRLPVDRRSASHDDHPDARTSAGGVVSPAIRCHRRSRGDVEGDKVSIWHPGRHDNPFGMRLTALMISKRVPDSSVPMSLLAEHPTCSSTISARPSAPARRRCTSPAVSRHPRTRAPVSCGFGAGAWVAPIRDHPSLRVVHFMKLRVPLIAILVPSALPATALAVFLATVSFDTTLEFAFEDSVSGGWVWGAVARLQDRALIGFYQSDTGPSSSHVHPSETWRCDTLRSKARRDAARLGSRDLGAARNRCARRIGWWC